MDALRNTINTQSVKTKQIVFQYPDGSFPEPGAILNMTDTRGHTDWTRAPNLDSVTLVDASGNEGVVTYTDASGLLVNNVPVGGGGGSVTGGTNIQVSGLGVVSFDPTGGVDMLGAPMINATQIGFTDSGKNATLLFDSTSTNGTLTLTNTTNTPQLSISAGAAASILTSTEASTKTNTITMSTSGANGTSTIAMTDGTTNAAVSYTEVNDQLTVSCSENLSIVAANSAHTIEMGTALGQVLVSTKGDPIVLARSDSLPSTAIQTVLKVDAIGVVQVGDAGVLTDPGLRFQGALNDSTIQLDDATNVLNVTSVSGAPLQLNVPLNDGTGTSGTPGYVLTSQGAAPPQWKPSSGGGAVSSISAGPTGNIVIAPTSGAVIVDLSQNVTLSDGTASLTLQPNMSQARVDMSASGGNTIGAVVLNDGGASGLFASATNPGAGVSQVFTNVDMDATNSAIRFRINDAATPPNRSQLKLEQLGGGVVSLVTIGDPSYTSLSENLQFTSGGKDIVLSFLPSGAPTGVLNVNSISGAPLQLNVPLNDGTGVAGTAGQVLTSQGAGTYPVWATSGTPVILESVTYTTPLSTPTPVSVDNSNFPSIPVSASFVTVQFTLQGGGGGGGGGLGIGFPPAGGVMSSGGGGGGGAGYTQTVTVTVPYGNTFTYTIGAGGGGGGGAQILLGSSDAGAGSPGGNTTVTVTSGSYTANGGGGGGGGSSSGGAQAGGAGSSPGFTGSFTFSGPGASGGDDGAGIVYGGAGGGTNGGLGGTSAGGAYGSPDGPTLPAMQGGQGVPSAANSGDGGGGGSGGAGGYGQTGGPGAPGYVKIDILSFV